MPAVRAETRGTVSEADRPSTGQPERDELIASAMTLARSAARVSRERTLAGVYRVLCAAGDGFPGLVMGWVGILDADSPRIIPVATWGIGLDEFQAIQVTADDSATGRGPSGTALRTGRMAVLDTVDDPCFAPWHDAASRHGYRSVASLPLKHIDGTPVGVLTLCSDREGFFIPVRQSMFMVFAEVASVAIENALQAERLAGHFNDLEATIRRRTEEVARRNEDLARANARLAEASQYKSEFLSHMSHDLRSPLTAILGFAEVLKDELYGPLNARQAEHLGHIRQAGRQLLDVIDDVVELSRVESGRTVLDTQDCFPRQILEAAAAQLGQVATTSRVTIAWSVKPEAERAIRADARKVKQVLFNLGSQAARSAGMGGKVSLVADAGLDTVTVEIAWTRPGPMLLPIDLTVRQSPGFGVSLAHRLVELHGGRVERKDAPDGGAFVVSLPAPAGPALGCAPGPSRGIDASDPGPAGR